MILKKLKVYAILSQEPILTRSINCVIRKLYVAVIILHCQSRHAGKGGFRGKPSGEQYPVTRDVKGPAAGSKDADPFNPFPPMDFPDLGILVQGHPKEGRGMVQGPGDLGEGVFIQHGRRTDACLFAGEKGREAI